ncbi:YolD-like family protein [Paenibacillus amylolyticus]|nr:YolD-like family protein [Paenibacillus amylolyticus]WFR60886.1 YolD-like family protein [Paenibacillus amylolyticus]
MSIKLAGNGLFESSRLILPEHREAWISHIKEQKRRVKPELDEQEIQRISDVLAESYSKSCTVDVVLFTPFYDDPVSGIVVGLNTSQREVKLMLDEEYRWVKLTEIISASV